jgi:hypothetical protein
MDRCVVTVANDEGQPIESATVGIYTSGTNVLAVIYDDDETSTITNPLTTDENGLAQAMLANGKYDIRIAKGDVVLPVRQFVAYDPNDGSAGAFTDANFELRDNTDPTKKLKFQNNGITTGTTRTLTVPDATGTIALTSQLPGSASTSAQGIVELSTDTEAKARTDTARALTPANLAAFKFTSSGVTISAAGSGTITHNLGTTAVGVVMYLKCTTAELGFSVGDEFGPLMALHYGAGATERGFSWRATSANAIDYKFHTNNPPTYVIRPDTGASAAINLSNWQAVFEVFVR